MTTLRQRLAPVLRLVLLLVALAALPIMARAAAERPAPATDAAPPAEATLRFMNRDLHTMRSEFTGADPATRAARALRRLENLDDAHLDTPVTREPFLWNDQRGVTLRLGDTTAFTVLERDLDAEEGLTLDQAVERAEERLRDAIRARVEMTRGASLVRGLLASLLASAIAVVLLWFLMQATKRAIRPLHRLIETRIARRQLLGIDWSEHAFRVLVRLAQAFAIVVGASIAYSWIAFVLGRFAVTAPLGSKMADFVADLLGRFGSGVLEAIPGLVTIAFILFVARGVVGAINSIFDGVTRGRFQVPGLHPETSNATRRILVVVTWALAFTLVYPYIPGSNSEVFKGLSVLFGFMLTLGSSGIVGQLMSGLVLVYSRALRIGDFVTVGDTDGVVKEMGVLSVKLVNIRNEEITIPNNVMVASSVRNYSKLAGQQGTLISTKVTIGYDAPWRQVHALLKRAAAATEGLRREPEPFVYQRALQDFYVEYELFAHIDVPIRRVPVLSQLHAAIQDEFNTAGVQIMSPHFMEQPAEAILVPKARWHEGTARNDAGAARPAA
ncbi:mechanosensitive ion channel family protein [Derxia gummosa]|uniref:Small-conductance mechanosensitive channel n=1 Tax=Derxia gummosa DSM 723 TaxID=1121388 RepID=A0A8B6X8D9_9BURK|nr:mechanosensitive ion channel domain-containing protein [Derxia gummosa]